MENAKSEIALALAKAQSQFIQPKKNKTVTVAPTGKRAYSFTYADYSEIVEAVRGPLNSNGIAFSHVLEFRNDKLLLVTRLTHGESGQSIESVWPMTSSDDPKEVGGDMTYGKRYSLSAITGCVADDDVDGDTPTGSRGTTGFQDRGSFEHDVPDPIRQTPAPKPANQNPVKIGAGAAPAAKKSEITGPQFSRMWAIAKAKDWTPDEVHALILKQWGYSSATSMTRAQYDELVTHIETWPPNRGTQA